MKVKKIGKTCRRCHRQYQVGYNGMANGLCDACAGVQRDANGYAWEPGENEMTLQTIATGEIRTVTRAEAFKK